MVTHVPSLFHEFVLRAATLHLIDHSNKGRKGAPIPAERSRSESSCQMREDSRSGFRENDIQVAMYTQICENRTRSVIRFSQSVGGNQRSCPARIQHQPLSIPALLTTTEVELLEDIASSHKTGPFFCALTPNPSKDPLGTSPTRHQMRPCSKSMMDSHSPCGRIDLHEHPCVLTKRSL
jgi:hypothetical protein